MPDYRTVKRPPNYREGDYILRALYKLLDKQYGTRHKPSRTPSPYRPMNRSFGRAPSSRGSGGRTSYVPQQRFNYNAPKENLLPKRSESSYPRESRPYVQSLPQPRTEPDVDELLRQLEQRFDDRLVEQVMAKLEAESNKVENASQTNPSDELPAESKEASADAGESPNVKQDVEKSAEDVKPEPSEPEPEPLDDLYELDLDELEWLDEEMHGLVVEAENGEPAFVTLEALEAGLEQTQDVPETGQSDLVRPEMVTVPLEPLIEVDPLKQLEPGVAELEEEVEDGEAEPV